MYEKIRNRFIAALLGALVGFSVVPANGADTETPTVLDKTVADTLYDPSTEAMGTIGADALYEASTEETGITEFSHSVTETDRQETYSTLSISAFHERTAAGSRWMMCRYAELAHARGFEYFAVVYPAESSNEVTVVFPSSVNPDDETLAKVAGKEGLMPTMPVELMGAFCGFR